MGQWGGAGKGAREGMTRGEASDGRAPDLVCYLDAFAHIYEKLKVSPSVHPYYKS